MKAIAPMRVHPGSTEAGDTLSALSVEADLGTNLMEAMTGEAPRLT